MRGPFMLWTARAGYVLYNNIQRISNEIALNVFRRSVLHSISEQIELLHRVVVKMQIHRSQLLKENWRETLYSEPLWSLLVFFPWSHVPINIFYSILSINRYAYSFDYYRQIRCTFELFQSSAPIFWSRRTKILEHCFELKQIVAIFSFIQNASTDIFFL